MIGDLRVFIRTLLSVLWIAFIIIPLSITWQLRLARLNSFMMMVSFYVGAILWGVRVKTVGTLSPVRPLLIVSNHFSYLDVFALGSRIPARFVTKREVASWPIIGFVCRIGSCLFIDRKRSQTLHNMSELNYAMNQGSIISLFPEGTTNDGSGMKPFKSSFFSLAEDGDITVQPISVIYTALSGKPFDAAGRPLVGWYGDAEFFPHMMRFFRESHVDVTLVFHDPVSAEAFPTRKEMARYCHDVIEKSVTPYL